MNLLLLRCAARRVRDEPNNLFLAPAIHVRINCSGLSLTLPSPTQFRKFTNPFFLRNFKVLDNLWHSDKRAH